MSLAFGNESRYHLTVRDRRSFNAHSNLAKHDFSLTRRNTAIVLVRSADFNIH
jgi:hypothetical protein